METLIALGVLNFCVRGTQPHTPKHFFFLKYDYVKYFLCTETSKRSNGTARAVVLTSPPPFLRFLFYLVFVDFVSSTSYERENKLVRVVGVCISENIALGQGELSLRQILCNASPTLR